MCILACVVRAFLKADIRDGTLSETEASRVARNDCEDIGDARAYVRNRGLVSLPHMPTFYSGAFCALEILNSNIGCELAVSRDWSIRVYTMCSEQC